MKITEVRTIVTSPGRNFVLLKIRTIDNAIVAWVKTHTTMVMGGR